MGLLYICNISSMLPAFHTERYCKQFKTLNQLLYLGSLNADLFGFVF